MALGKSSVDFQYQTVEPYVPLFRTLLFYPQEYQTMASVIFADEPTGNLDTHNRDEIQRLLFEVREKFVQTIVMVTHDEKLAEMADRKIVMSDGAIL